MKEILRFAQNDTFFVILGIAKDLLNAMPKIIVTEKGSLKKEIVEFSHEDIGIGRSGENRVKLQSEAISRKHANILVSGNNFFLVDLGSGNGTFLNGVALKPNEKSLLKHGDMISIDKFNLNFNQIDEMLASSFNEITDSDILEVKLLKKVLRAIDKESVPSIEVMSGNFAGKKFFISEGTTEFFVGRDDACEFQIEEYVVSRKHAKILRKSGKVYVEDLQSKNGTLLNNNKLTGEHELHDGDRITFGTIIVIFRDPKEVKIGKINVKKKEPPKEEQPPEIVEKHAQEEPKPPLPMESSIGGDILDEQVEEELPIDDYPTPRPRSEIIKFSTLELGMMGLGVVIFVFAVISFISLIK